MIPLYHVGEMSAEAQKRFGVKGPTPCMGVAFSVLKQHTLHGDDWPAANVVKLDGTPPQRGEPTLCGTCQQPIHVSWLSYTAPRIRGM